MLNVSDLVKTYQTRGEPARAVQGISFKIEEGEFYSLLGPSGCGKSTTLQCVAGLETPDAGGIEMAGEHVFLSANGINIPGYRRDIGMVFQSYAIWPHMTVFQNVAFPLVHGRQANRIRSKSKVRERVMAALRQVHLEEYEDRPAPFLSGGQQQRVALARALVHEPNLLLLDEPLSNLDAKLREDMRDELQLIVKRLGTTTLYVTHDQVEAMAMSDRIAVMSEGRIVQEGTPREIYELPRNEFVADFIGNANFLQGAVKAVESDGSAQVDCELGLITCRTRRTVQVGDEVRVGVRPDVIKIEGHDIPEDLGPEGFVGILELASFIGNSLHCVIRVGDAALRTSADPRLELVVGKDVYGRLLPGRAVVVGIVPTASTS